MEPKRTTEQAERLLYRVRRGKQRRRYWTPVAVAGLLCFALFNFVLGIEVVSGQSMSPSLFSGDIIIYQRVGYQPQVGDMVVVQSGAPVDTIKRVVGTQGDVLDVTSDGHITRNGQAVYEPNVWYGWQESAGWVTTPFTVPDGSCFCMGDNRAFSLDSRASAIGPVPVRELGGKVLITIRGQ